MNPFLIIGNRRYITTTTTRKLTNSGTAVWGLDHGNDVRGLTLDSDGNILTCGTNSYVRKYDAAGNLLWSANPGGLMYSVCTGSDGRVYTGGAVYSSLSARRFNSAGTLQASANTYTQINSVALLPNGRLLAAVTYGSNGNLYCFNDAYFVRDWKAYIGSGTLYALAIIDDEYFYVAGAVSSSKSIWKLRTVNNNVPTVIWNRNHGGTVYAIATDAAHNLYIGGAVASSITTRKYDQDGNLLWSVNHGATVYAIAVDDAGNVYTGGAEYGGYTNRKYSPSGELLGSFNVGAIVYSIALIEQELSGARPPGLSFPVALRKPSVGFSIRANGLRFPLGLGLFTSSAVNAPPDLTTIRGVYRQVYRLYLLTDTGMVELPLASIQCRRRAGASTWMTVDIPVYTLALGIQCEAHIGKEIIVYAGVVDDDGERVGEFLRAELTEVSRQWSYRAGSITLTARVDNPYFTAKERVLQGVVARGQDDAGRRRATCSVDPALRPNDTVDDGIETWIAGNISYRISPNENVMTVGEVG